MSDQQIRIVLTGSAVGLQQAAQAGNRSLATVEERSRSLSRELSSLGRAGIAAFLGGSLVGAAGAAARALYQAAAASERLAIGLKFASNGQAGRELVYLRDLTQSMGLSMADTASSYVAFAAAARGTSLEGEGARKVFTEVSKAAAVMGLSADQASGVLLALQQMVSKGTVSAEELRGQLGERLPGAFQIAARSMGVTTSELGKMLERGEVLSTDFLPKFAEQLRTELGGSAEEAADRMDAATARMGNAWERLLAALGQSGGQNGAKAVMGDLTETMDTIAERMELARVKGAGFFGQMLAGAVALGGRSGALRMLSSDFQTLDGQLAESTKRVSELRSEVEQLRAKGFGPGMSLRSDLAAAESDLAEVTANRQLLRGGGSLGGSDIRADRAGAAYRVEQERAAAAKAAAEAAAKARRAAGGTRAARPTDYIGQAEDAFARRLQDYEERNQEALDRVEQQEAEAAERRQKTAAEFAADMAAEAQALNVSLIQDDRERITAQIELERAGLQARIDAMAAAGADVSQAQASLNELILAKQREMNTQMQRQAEQNRSELARTWDGMAEDIFVTLGSGGKVDWQGMLQGLAQASMRDMWTQLKKDGGGTTSGAIDAAMERLGFAAKGLTSDFTTLNSGLGMFGNVLQTAAQAVLSLAASAGGSSSGGFLGSLLGMFNPGGTTTVPQSLTDMSASTVGMSLAVGTNRIPADGWKYLHKDEAVLPKAFNPWAGGTGVGGGTVVVNSPVNIGNFSGSDTEQARLMRVLDERDRRLEARLAGMLSRRGSAMYNAARA